MIMEDEELLRNTLPKDIHMEILSWIPTRSLLTTFKLVCKAWQNLIHGPDFVNMHLNRGAIINGRGRRSNRGLIRKPGNVIYHLLPPFNYDCPPLDLERLSSYAATTIELDFDIDFDHFDFEWSFSRIIGSCNGLLCLSINYDDNIILLNPSTRKYKVSPKQLIQCPSQFASDNDVTYGFGSMDDDEYKVVRIANFYTLHSNVRDRTLQFQIDLYSMSSNSWRRWEGGDFPFEEINDIQIGLFLNGHVHWIGCKVLHGPVWDMIVSFNIREEEFGQLPMPPSGFDVVSDQYDSRGRYPFMLDDISLMNVRGCLGSLFYLSRTQEMDIDLEIWVMKEYGIKESWTKEFVIRTLDSKLPRELSGFSMMGLSGFSMMGLKSITCAWAGDQIIIEERLSFAHPRDQMKYKLYGRRVSYDINKKKIDGDVMMEVDDFDWQQEQADYIETLVSLKSSLQLPLSNSRKRKNCG